MASVLQAVGIEKWRGKRRVLERVDLEVHHGEILTILGPNGAGKSTLIAILAGLLRPDAGSVRLLGEDLARLGSRAYVHMGVALQRYGLSPRLTVREVIAFFSLCYGGDRPVDELLKRFRLAEKQHMQIRQLSEGEKHRVSLLLAFLKSFDVLLLDEPTAGIDPEGRRGIWDEMRRARERGAAVVCATHLVDEAHHLSDRLLVLHAGRKVALDSPQALLARLQGREKVEIANVNGMRSDVFAQLPGVTEVLCNGHTMTLYCHSARQVMRVLLAQEVIPNISCGMVSMEDVFRLLTAGKGSI
jgi:ABC-2 type transport system ATP-binding protein